MILWLGYPRRDGDRNDCFAVFTRLVQRGGLLEDESPALTWLQDRKAIRR